MMACTSSVVSETDWSTIPPSKTDSSLEYSIRSSKFSKTRSVQVLSEGQPPEGHQRDVLTLCIHLLSLN